MIHRALLYLLLRRLKNAVLGLKGRPGRLVAIVLLVSLFASMIAVGGSAADMDGGRRLHVLVSLLALYLVLSLFGGLSEPGPIFTPPDIDFVLPGPFRRREILVYYLLRYYAQMLLLGLLYAVFLGAAETRHPVLTWLGVVLCLIVATQIQTAMTLFTGAVGDRVFGRVRLVSRLVFVGVLAVAIVAIVSALAGKSEVGNVLASLLATPVARVVFYPAVAVGEMAMAPDTTAALTPLLGLLACVAASFGLVLIFPVDFVETAATRAERKQRARAKTAAGTHRDLRSLPLLWGAGSVAWLNVLTLKRRLRIVVAALVMLLFFMLFAGVRSAEGGRGDVPPMLVLLAFFPLLAQIPLGFKGHREHLEAFKALPVAPLGLAFAEVIVPAVLMWLLQAAIVVVVVALGKIDAVWMWAALVAYPVLDVGMIALSDVFQLGRDPRHMGFFLVSLQMAAMMATVLPAMIAGVLVFELTEDPMEAAAAGVLAHAAVDVLLLHLLGRRFRAWEPTQAP